MNITTNKTFAENPFLIGHDNVIFSKHEELGFVVCDGKFPQEKKFVELEQIIDNIKHNSDYPVILNIGDSSTSGWDSDSITKTVKITNSCAPFFHYKTYSDIMRNEYINVINAGVSGYSSFQGKKYLAYLLKYLARQGIQISYVTIYFGNNDSAFSVTEDKASIDFMKPSCNTDQRVIVKDFEKNILSMLDTAKAYGAVPILITPVKRYDWTPGLRSLKNRHEYDQGRQKLLSKENKKLKDKLEQAVKFFRRGDLKSAYEADIFLPRIKMSYEQVLKEISHKTKTPIIDVQKMIPLKDTDNKYFCDYCHPLEPVNTWIVEKFDEIIKKQGIKLLKATKNTLEKKESSPSVYPLY